MTDPVEAFLTRWQSSGAAERANYALFLTELCDVLEVPRPEPTVPDDSQNAYVFERAVTFQNGDGTTSGGRIDLYRRGCFVLEAKQGVSGGERDCKLKNANFKLQIGEGGTGAGGEATGAGDDAMLRARGQAEQYARAIAEAEEWPPFLIVVDVGHSIELYAESSRSGKTYLPYPDPNGYRIRLSELREEGVRERLRGVWLEPMSLDPSRRRAEITREAAAKLAELAKSLDRSGHAPGEVAHFLMR